MFNNLFLQNILRPRIIDEPTLRNFEWLIDEDPFTTGELRISEEDEPEKPPKVFFEQPLQRIKKDDKIIIYEKNEEPIYTVTVKGNTVRSVLDALKEGFSHRFKAPRRDQPISEWKFPDTNQDIISNIYSEIAMWVDSEDRLNFIKEFETGKGVTFGFLGGDHHFFEGLYSKGDHIWRVAKGS